ncbi:cationic amino acid transporter 1-like [Fagus crenata]
MAYIAAGNILLEYVIGGAAVARSWTSYFATLLNHQPNDFRIVAHSFSPDYRYLNPITIVVLTVICVMAIMSTKGSSRFNYIASIFHVAVILFIIIGGLIKADTKNYTPFIPFGCPKLKIPVVTRDIPIGLVGSMVITTLAYCLLAVTLYLMQSYKDVDVSAPFSVAAGALKGMTTVLLVSAVGQARYLTHIARTHMLPPWFAHVNEKIGTPVNATIVMIVATAIIAFFTSLGILSNLEPKIWGAPLVPWLPSLSIAINIFLLGSIDRASFERFGLWTLIILVYYLLFGLHASYDTAMESSSHGTQLKNVERGLRIREVI